MNNIAIILAGGSGNRLWPLSTSNHPKSLLAIFSKKSMLEASIFRAKLFADTTFVVTNDAMAKTEGKILQDLGVQPENIIIEPANADTAAAIAFCIASIKRQYGPSTTVTLLPVDHQIRNHGAFYRDMRFALAAATHNTLTLFGISPSFAATGYGYIRLSNEKSREGRTALFNVASFSEKPNSSTAEQFLQDPNYVWNSGIFTGTIKAFEDMFEKQPVLYDWYSAVLRHQDTPMPVVLRDFQFEHRLIENNPGDLQAVMATFDWKDIGTYDELYRSALETDEFGNATKGDVTLKDCSDCLIVGSRKRIVTLGLNDIAVIDGPDGILVCQKTAYSQLVGKIATGKNQPT
jgi:mannose-1-phosphate guanylyltransferase/mannose-6-phosphate isomerase